MGCLTSSTEGRVDERIGGHRDVKGLAVEDIGIGKRVKAAGMGLLFANGRRVMRTRMSRDLSETCLRLDSNTQRIYEL